MSYYQVLAIVLIDKAFVPSRSLVRFGIFPCRTWQSPTPSAMETENSCRKGFKQLLYGRIHRLPVSYASFAFLCRLYTPLLELYKEYQPSIIPHRNCTFLGLSPCNTTMLTLVNSCRLWAKWNFQGELVTGLHRLKNMVGPTPCVKWAHNEKTTIHYHCVQGESEYNAHATLIAWK